MPRYSLVIRVLAVLALGAVIGYGILRGWDQKKSAVDADSQVQSIAVESFQLSNAMEVVLLPNHRVPAVSHTIWLRVGAADDPLGKSGLAHYHEHLMFKRTASYKDGDYSRMIESLGGEFNAFTGPDFTGYYVNIARDYLPDVMRLEADRLQRLAPTEADYAKERDVIIEERQSRIESQPAAIWSEQMNAALYQHHPYRIPVIGWMHEMKQLAPADAQAFYREYYHAGNMVLIVSGDITRAELEPMAEQFYGTIPARPAYKRQWVSEPEQRAARTVSFEHSEVQQPRWHRRYLAPGWNSSNTQEVMALSLLAHWLGSGKTSLLYERLVQKQELAVSASAYYSGLSVGPDNFSIDVTPREGVSLETIEAAVNDVLNEIKTTPIQRAELKRIKTLFRADLIYARDGLQPMAQWAGYLRMLDLPLDYLNGWAALVDAVTADAMRQQAEQVLVKEHSVTGYLRPAPALPDAKKEKPDA